MTVELSAEARAQLELRHDLATWVARRYCDAGFSVVYQDVLIGSSLPTALAALRPYPVSVVVLCPSIETITERENARGKRGYPDAQAIEAFDHILRQQTPRIGYWLDTSSLTLEETLEDVLRYLERPGIG